jgi:hypothetical protein
MGCVKITKRVFQTRNSVYEIDESTDPATWSRTKRSDTSGLLRSDGGEVWFWCVYDHGDFYTLNIWGPSLSPGVPLRQIQTSALVLMDPADPAPQEPIRQPGQPADPPAPPAATQERRSIPDPLDGASSSEETPPAHTR